jgi:hypothetical protein
LNPHGLTPLFHLVQKPLGCIPVSGTQEQVCAAASNLAQLNGVSSGFQEFLCPFRQIETSGEVALF